MLDSPITLVAIRKYIQKFINHCIELFKMLCVYAVFQEFLYTVSFLLKCCAFYQVLSHILSENILTYFHTGRVFIQDLSELVVYMVA